MRTPSLLHLHLLVLPVLTAVCVLLTQHTARAQAAYVIQDSDSGQILESLNPNKKLQIASLTKIATAMVTLDWAVSHSADLAQLTTVPPSIRHLDAQGIGLRPGDRISLRDLLYAAIMQSDNASAETLATHVGRSLAEGSELEPTVAFVSQMNALARKLSMKNTRFLNAHGLDSTEFLKPHSTAADMAKLACYAMNNSAFRFYASQKNRRIAIVSASNGPSGYMLHNTNELLGVDSIDGVKTGTTQRAGPCLIVSAARPPESRKEGDEHFITPRRLIVVVLNAEDRFPVARKLLNQGWELHEAWVSAGRPAPQSSRLKL